jgi:primosomal protein N'
VERLGPAPAAVRRVMKKYRWHLALLSKSPARLNTLARAIRQAFGEQANIGHIQLKIDLDPYGMY